MLKVWLGLIESQYPRVKDLRITVPQRSGTTQTLARWVAECFWRNPASKFIYCSYTQALADLFKAQVATAMGHGWSILAGSPSVLKVIHPHTGERTGGHLLVVGSGAPICGYGAGGHGSEFGGAIIVDEPYGHGPNAWTAEAQRYFEEVLAARRNHPGVPMIVLEAEHPGVPMIVLEAERG